MNIDNILTDCHSEGTSPEIFSIPFGYYFLYWPQWKQPFSFSLQTITLTLGEGKIWTQGPQETNLTLYHLSYPYLEKVYIFGSDEVTHSEFFEIFSKTPFSSLWKLYYTNATPRKIIPNPYGNSEVKELL